jgi:hypothetical protein
VVKKMGRGGCDACPLKVEIKITSAQSSASAFQSQILNFQTAHIAHRFGLSVNMAAIVAVHAFEIGRASR